MSAKQPTLREMLASTLDRLAALESTVAASPAVAVAPATPANGFIAFLQQRAVEKIASGTHVACEVPACGRAMSAARTTTLTIGTGKSARKVRACKRHFRRA